MLKKLAAISLAAGALVLIAPVAANAADNYSDTPVVSVDKPVITSCDVSTVAFGAGYFAPSETVSISVSGESAGDAAVSGNTAGADGSLLVAFRPPSDGKGAYSISFDGTQASGATAYSTVVTVSTSADGPSCNNSAAGAGSELPLSGGTTELALTGGDVSPWVLGGGAAALIAGGSLVAVGVARRKRDA